MLNIDKYIQYYPLTISKIQSLVEDDYLFKNIPTEEMLDLSRRFYLECDQETLLEIHSDFEINSGLGGLLCAKDTVQAEIAAWKIQHAMNNYIIKNFKHIFNAIFIHFKEEYIQKLNKSLYQDLAYCANL